MAKAKIMLRLGQQPATPGIARDPLKVVDTSLQCLMADRQFIYIAANPSRRFKLGGIRPLQRAEALVEGLDGGANFVHRQSGRNVPPGQRYLKLSLLPPQQAAGGGGGE